MLECKWWQSGARRSILGPETVEGTSWVSTRAANPQTGVRQP